MEPRWIDEALLREWMSELRDGFVVRGGAPPECRTERDPDARRDAIAAIEEGLVPRLIVRRDDGVGTLDPDVLRAWLVDQANRAATPGQATRSLVAALVVPVASSPAGP